MKLTLTISGQSRNVEISQPFGAAGEVYHLYIDKFYKGIFLKRQGKWEYCPQKENEFSSDDIQILIEIIESG